MAAFQAYNRLLVSEDRIENVRAGEAILGYEFRSQYPSYRGTFLSCIEGLEVYADGERVPDESVFFKVNGKQFLIPQLKELYAEYWFILDKATIRVLRDGGLKPGKHSIEVRMKHRIPYTGYFGQYMVLDGSCERELQVK
jgi:hypothetical protein